MEGKKQYTVFLIVLQVINLSWFISGFRQISIALDDRLVGFHYNQHK